MCFSFLSHKPIHTTYNPDATNNQANFEYQKLGPSNPQTVLGSINCTDKQSSKSELTQSSFHDGTNPQNLGHSNNSICQLKKYSCFYKEQSHEHQIHLKSRKINAQFNWQLKINPKSTFIC